jgi:Ca2+-binding EF-hand superfamily protein
MKELVPVGVCLAALFTAAAAIAQPAPTSTSLPQPAHARRNYFTSNQPRSDVAARVAKMFSQLDLNHDGFITADELASSKAKFEDRMSKSAPKRAEKAFDRLDTNHDGQITRSDLEAAQAARRPAKKTSTGNHRSSSNSLFAQADANKDDIVTRAEYGAAVASGKIKTRRASMRGSAIARLFDLADADKEGRVSLEEARKAALMQFDAADLDHDGILTPAERRQASKSERAKRHATATRAARD